MKSQVSESERVLIYRLLVLLMSTCRSLATSPAVTGCISPRWARNTDRALLRYLSKRNTSLRTENRRFKAQQDEKGGEGSLTDEVGGGQNLKSGRVNFILPCSVAIFRARGTASSHLERTHSRSHLSEKKANQWQDSKGRGGVRCKSLT